MKKNDLSSSVLQVLVFVVFFTVISCIGCAGIKLPGADHITKIRAEVYYDASFRLVGEGKTLDEVIDSLELQYKQGDDIVIGDNLEITE